MTSLNMFILNLFETMWARSEKEMAEGFPITLMVTTRIWNTRSRMHQLVMCLEHSVDN